jgi:membrane protein DedA with SNARE-associated domain
VQHFIASYSYAAVFLLMLAESACIPIPSELIMLFGGALAAGAVPGAHPALAGIIAAGAAGNVAGSYLAWAAGRRWGLAAVRRWGGRIGLREHDVDRAVGWFERYGPAAVFFGRLVPVVRTFISLPAGFARMPAGRFGAYTAAGCIPWTAGLAIAGYAVGSNWQAVANSFHGPTYVIAAVLVIALIVAILRHRARRTGTPAPQEDAETAPGQTERQPPTRDGPGADSQRRALRQAVAAAEFAVLEAQQAGTPTGELDELCRRLRLTARVVVSSPLPAEPALSPGRPDGQPPAAIEDLMAAAGMIVDAAASAAAQAQDPPAAGTPADGLRPQAEAIAARIASAAEAVGPTSAS